IRASLMIGDFLDYSVRPPIRARRYSMRNIMARVTVEDCLDNVDNRFELVMLATKRSRQLATGGKEPKVAWENDKTTVVALREIAEGLISDEIMAEDALLY